RQVVAAGVGRGVAAVGEGVNPHMLDAFGFGQTEQGVEMVEMGVDAAVAAQAEQMELPAAGMVHRAQQGGVAVEAPIGNGLIEAGDVHLHDAAGADVQVTDLAVAHLTLGQSDERAGGVDEGVGELAQQAVIDRLAGARDGVAFARGTVAPAVKNDQDERELAHRTESALRPGKRARGPSSSSMRSNWLYLATRSVRLAEPVLIWPALVATARSAMKVSSVSPERWEMMLA